MAKRITDVDKEIGAHIKAIRTSAGLSQSALGERLDVTFQQVQKYEKGINRISVAAFISICLTLDIKPMDILGEYFGDASATKMSPLVAEVIELRTRLSQIKSIAA
jgi:transcriptional regulator with XRE-family HTH domain